MRQWFRPVYISIFSLLKYVLPKSFNNNIFKEKCVVWVAKFHCILRIKQWMTKISSVSAINLYTLSWTYVSIPIQLQTTTHGVNMYKIYDIFKTPIKLSELYCTFSRANNDKINQLFTMQQARLRCITGRILKFQPGAVSDYQQVRNSVEKGNSCLYLRRSDSRLH